MLELFRSRRRAIVWFIEAGLLGTIVIVAAGFTMGWEGMIGVDRLFDAATITLVAQTSLYYHGLYGRALWGRFTTVSLQVVRALLVAALLVWFVLPWTLSEAALRPSVLTAALCLAAVVLPTFRAAVTEVYAYPALRRRLLILGSGPLASACAEAAEANMAAGVRYVGRVVPDEEGYLFYDKPDILSTSCQLMRTVREYDIRHIIVCQNDRRGRLPIADLLELKFSGIEVEEGANFYERLTGRVFSAELRPSQLVFADGYYLSSRTSWCKRLLDIVGAAVGLILALPLMILTALAIKLDSKGPVIYSQERVGAFGHRFFMHKLRSMRLDAESDGVPKFAAEHDPRMTRVGRLIRRSRLDELPQLWNVLVGEMSLVGPRPERPAFVEQLEQQIPYFRQRLFVKPGVTGHAQVRCRYSAAIEDHQEKLEHDLFYIKNVSVWFDLSILVDTVKVVLLRVGSR